MASQVGEYLAPLLMPLAEKGVQKIGGYLERGLDWIGNKVFGSSEAKSEVLKMPEYARYKKYNNNNYSNPYYSDYAGYGGQQYYGGQKYRSPLYTLGATREYEPEMLGSTPYSDYANYLPQKGHRYYDDIYDNQAQQRQQYEVPTYSYQGQLSNPLRANFGASNLQQNRYTGYGSQLNNPGYGYQLPTYKSRYNDDAQFGTYGPSRSVLQPEITRPYYEKGQNEKFIPRNSYDEYQPEYDLDYQTPQKKMRYNPDEFDEVNYGGGGVGNYDLDYD